MFVLPTLPFAKGFGYRAAGTLMVSSAVGRCAMRCCGYPSVGSCAKNVPLHCTQSRGEASRAVAGSRLAWCISQTKGEEELPAALEEGQREVVGVGGKPTEKVSQESCPQPRRPVQHCWGVAPHRLCKHRTQNTAGAKVSEAFPVSCGGGTPFLLAVGVSPGEDKRFPQSQP